MTTNFREMLNIESLAKALNIETTKSLDSRQKKAVKNIKYATNDKWQWVNSWYDQHDESAREYMMDAERLFNDVYSDSLTDIYDDGCVHFGAGAQSFLKDIKFCGKEFLEKVTLYFVAKFMEESVPEVEATEEDIKKVNEDLQKIYNRVYGLQEDDMIHEMATRWGLEVKKTRDGEEWISIDQDMAQKLYEEFSLTTNLKITSKRTKVTVEQQDGRKYVLSTGKNPYLWRVA